ncbi:hypothetical protein [Micromonospora sp. IBSANI012]|uniref:hypothetical protein n=1 Tax=Micromonospora sp. IBSANI012 TaxID=3457761 RepID=UPI0040598B27
MALADKLRIPQWEAAMNPSPLRQRDLMKRAAGVSTMKAVCHRDTWDVLVANAPYWFTAPKLGNNDKAIVLRDGGMIEVTLSGPDVTQVLRVAYKKSRPWADAFSHQKVVLLRIHAAFAEVVGRVDPAAGQGQAIPPVIIDDRINVE